MSNTAQLNRPVLICFYGFPGSGKTYIARQLSETFAMAHVSADRVRSELFEDPRFDAAEDSIVTQIMNYMTHEFLSAGISVAYDANALRSKQRYDLREVARKSKAEHLLIWIQIDPDSAYARTQRRDRRTSDDRYSMEHSEHSFQHVLSGMQNPQATEDYLVVSGKHAFKTQQTAIVNKLYQLGLVSTASVQHTVTKPGLVNLVPNPNAGRVDLNRRNIMIR